MILFIIVITIMSKVNFLTFCLLPSTHTHLALISLLRIPKKNIVHLRSFVLMRYMTIMKSTKKSI